MPRGAQLKSVLPAAASCLIRRDFFPARLVLKLGCSKRLAIVQRVNPLPALLKLLLPCVALLLWLHADSAGAEPPAAGRLPGLLAVVIELGTWPLVVRAFIHGRTPLSESRASDGGAAAVGYALLAWGSLASAGALAAGPLWSWLAIGLGGLLIAFLLRRQPGPRLWLVLVAFFCLGAARVAIEVLPFRWIASAMSCFPCFSATITRI